jgi:hypothetical protein
MVFSAGLLPLHVGVVDLGAEKVPPISRLFFLHVGQHVWVGQELPELGEACEPSVEVFDQLRDPGAQGLADRADVLEYRIVQAV